MTETDGLSRLIAFMERGVHPGIHKGPSLDLEGLGTECDLLSLLSLPELREENNPDLPFRVGARFRGNAVGDSIQTVGLENLRYDRECMFLAEWMERLTGRLGVHCFDRSLAAEFADSGEGLVQLQINREGGRTSLSSSYDGPNRKGEMIEVWERGVLVRRRDTSSEGERIPTLLQDGTAVVVRRGASDCGVEVLVAEGEFGSNEWKALLACLCLRGDLGRALGLLKERIAENSSDVLPLSRFRSFLASAAAVTKADGYVLRPVPVVRSSEITAKVSVVSDGGPSTEYHEDWRRGWNHLAHRDYGSASRSFSSYYTASREDCCPPLEERLIRHLESLERPGRGRKEEVELTARFWEGIFRDLP